MLPWNKLWWTTKLFSSLLYLDGFLSPFRKYSLLNVSIVSTVSYSTVYPHHHLFSHHHSSNKININSDVFAYTNTMQMQIQLLIQNTYNI